MIDDLKTFHADVIARTYEAGIACLKHLPITELYLDHDLGGKLTGLDILKTGVQLPDKIRLITMNPVGRENMKNWLTANGYVAEPHLWFRRTK